MDDELQSDLLVYLESMRDRVLMTGKFNEGLAANHGAEFIKAVRETTQTELDRVDDLIERVSDA